MAARWVELLERCRERFGSPPREFTEEERASFRLAPSSFMRLGFLLTRDKLRVVLREQDRLRDHGRVVWGHFVQANMELFDPRNRRLLPANVIYSPDAYFDDRVPMLQALAGALFQLKGKSPKNDELRAFARALTDELATTMRLPLPNSLSEGREVFFTTCLIQPSHLPGGCLASGFFPIVICPEMTDAVMVLPARYWPEELCAIFVLGPNASGVAKPRAFIRTVAEYLSPDLVHLPHVIALVLFLLTVLAIGLVRLAIWLFGF